jgi:hypothetical protein
MYLIERFRILIIIIFSYNYIIEEYYIYIFSSYNSKSKLDLKFRKIYYSNSKFNLKVFFIYIIKEYIKIFIQSLEMQVKFDVRSSFNLGRAHHFLPSLGLLVLSYNGS